MKQIPFYTSAMLLLLCINLGSKAQNIFLPETIINKSTYKHIPNEFIQANDSVLYVNIIGDKVYLDDDIYLGDTTMLNQYQIKKNMPGNLLFAASINDNLAFNTRWPNAVVPFKIYNGFSEEEVITIRKAMNHIMQKTHVCFVPRLNQKNYLRIKKVTIKELGFEGGQSYLGMWPHGPQDLLFSASNFAQGLVVHELGHAIGFIHEHNRNDRDDHGKIIYDNIKDGMEGQFYKYPFISSTLTTYDYYSIMHYKPKNFSKNGEQTIVKLLNPTDQRFGRSDTLTFKDIRGINRIYPREKSCTPLPLSGEIVSNDELKRNQTISVNVYAKYTHNFIDVFVRAGQTFKFTASSTDYWYNKSGTPWEARCNANGISNDIGQSLSRHSSFKILSLIGEVFTENNNILTYTGKHFKIGTSKTWTAPRSGYLQLFANDILTGGYADNSGKVKVTIKRIN